MQINVSNISVEYDGTPVIYQADFVIHENEKIALIGRNGCGKTTLLKVLTGEVEYQKGEDDAPYGIFTSGNPVIGFLKQTSNDDKAKTMFDEILDAYSSLIKIEKDMESALEDLQNDSCDQNVRRYSRLCEQFEREGGYTYKKEYLTAVKKFGFSNEDMQKPLCEFSGGQRTKISLLKLLLSKPDVLLLDEPTNHLDLEAIEWLENYLCAYKKSCVIVSHDRMFLDKIVNVVYEIEYGETKRYQGTAWNVICSRVALISLHTVSPVFTIPLIRNTLPHDGSAKIASAAFFSASSVIFGSRKQSESNVCCSPKSSFR